MSKGVDLAAVVSAFGAAAKKQFANRGISGAQEDQLRTPLEALVADMAELSGLPRNALGLVTETTLSHLSTRPDFAVTLRHALIGFIEVKAPGKGADPRKFTDDHDKKQWDKLKTLPNLIYTDGNAFSLWQDGELAGSVVRLDGDVETSGAALAAPPAPAGTVLQLPRLGADSAAERQAARPDQRAPVPAAARGGDGGAGARATRASPRWPANGATCCFPTPATSSSPTAMPRPSPSACSWRACATSTSPRVSTRRPTSCASRAR